MNRNLKKSTLMIPYKTQLKTTYSSVILSIEIAVASGSMDCEALLSRAKQHAVY